jgi:hypothetical protein
METNSLLRISCRHTPITPLLEDDDIASAYESTYIKIAGDMKHVLDRSMVKPFLALLLIDFDQELTELHVTEFMEVYIFKESGFL